MSSVEVRTRKKEQNRWEVGIALAATKRTSPLHCFFFFIDQGSFCSLKLHYYHVFLCSVADCFVVIMDRGLDRRQRQSSGKCRVNIRFLLRDDHVEFQRFADGLRSPMTCQLRCLSLFFLQHKHAHAHTHTQNKHAILPHRKTTMTATTMTMYFDDASRHGTESWDPESSSDGSTPKWEIQHEQQQQSEEQDMIQRILTGYDAAAASQLSRAESKSLFFVGAKAEVAFPR